MTHTATRTGETRLRPSMFTYLVPIPADLSKQLRESAWPRPADAYIVDVSIRSLAGNPLPVRYHITRQSDCFLITLLECSDVEGIADWTIRLLADKAQA
jgi:hypothetical protein